MKNCTMKSIVVAALVVSGFNMIKLGQATDLAAAPTPQVQYVRAIPQCGRTQYVGSDYFVLNTCNIKVTITVTSDGPLWGTAILDPGERQLFSGMGIDSPRKSGVISLYTCPGYATPVTPDGRQLTRNYHGAYTCQQ